MNEPSLGNVVNALFCSITADLAPLEVGVEEKVLQQQREKAQKQLDTILKANCSSLSLPIDEYQELYSDLQVRVSRYTKTSRIEEMLREIDDNCEKRMERALTLSQQFIGKTEAASFAVSALMGIYDFVMYGPIMGTLLSVPQFLASGSSAIELNNEKKIASPWKLASIALSIIPSLEFLYAYSLSKHPFFLEGGVQYSFIPALHFLAGVVIPGKIMSDAILHNDILSLQKEKIPPLRSLRRPLRNSMRRLGVILDEIDEVQSIEGAENQDCTEIVTSFEQEGITYLQGNSGIDKIKARREQIRRKCLPPTVNLESSPRAGNGDSSAYRLERPEIVHENTYEIALSLGIVDKTARRIARTVTEKEAESIITALRSAVQDHSIALLQANPRLFFLRGDERRTYFDALHKLTSQVSRKYGEVIPEVYHPSHNPTAYSTLEGMDYLERTLLGEVKVTTEITFEEQVKAHLEREGYQPLALLRAIILKGFHVGTARPNIGMSYVYFLKIRARTQKASGITVREMDHFDYFFENLIRGGVVLDDKVYKGGGGKFPGCYSITPHLKDIKSDSLRQYIAYCLYQHPT